MLTAHLCDHNVVLIPLVSFLLVQTFISQELCGSVAAGSSNMSHVQDEHSQSSGHCGEFDNVWLFSIFHDRFVFFMRLRKETSLN